MTSERLFSVGCNYKKGSVEIITDIYFRTGQHIPAGTEMVEHNEFRIAKGSKFMDLAVFYDSFEHFAISKRFKQLLEDNAVKGWSCFPIKIVGTDLEYFVFRPVTIAGKTINLNEVNSYKDKRKLDLSDWSGDGIFTFHDSTHIVCTEKVKSLLEENAITNVSFQEL